MTLITDRSHDRLKINEDGAARITYSNVIDKPVWEKPECTAAIHGNGGDG